MGVPKGLVIADEEDPWSVDKNEDYDPEEFTPATATTLSKSLDSWQLLNPGLNADGRWRNAEVEDAEADEEEKKDDSTPEFPPLGPLPADSWGVGLAGERACVRSTVWHGAIGLGADTYFLNVYVGYGIRSSVSCKSVQSYCPPFPW